MESLGLASNLLDDDVDLISVLHVEVLGGLVLVQSLTIEEEPDVVGAQLYGKGCTLWRWQ